VSDIKCVCAWISTTDEIPPCLVKSGWNVFDGSLHVNAKLE